MRESKAELTDRLRRERRWDAFVRRREDLRADGTPASDAWRVAALEFEPLTPEPAMDADGGGELPIDPCDLDGKPPVPMLEAITWVFETLDKQIAPSSAPSAGALSLRNWVRANTANRSTFYSTFVPRLLPNRQQIEQRERMYDDGRDILELIEVVQRAREAAGLGSA